MRPASAAREVLESSLAIVGELTWTSFRRWPEALLAELELAEGRHDRAWEMLRAGLCTFLQLGDPGWEGMYQRGLGLLAGPSKASSRLCDARARSIRLPDGYLRVEAYCLDALRRGAIEAGSRQARAWVADLDSLAARTGRREMSVRACLHKAAVGHRDAGSAARELDNAALHSLLEASQGLTSPRRLGQAVHLAAPRGPRSPGPS